MEPGQSRTVHLFLPGRAGKKSDKPENKEASPGESKTNSDRIPAHVTVGLRAGPRLTVLAAPRGFEAVAATAATEFSADTTVAQLDGSVVVVPILRPGGRFAAGGRPVRSADLWEFPGDVGGSRREREAFTIFSETCVGAQVVVLLTAPMPGRVGLPLVRGDVDDPRFRRLSLHSGLPLVVHVRPMPGQLGAAARDAGNTLIELVAPQCEAIPSAVAILLGALRRLCDLIGLTPPTLFPGAAPEVRGATRAVAAAASQSAPAQRPATFARLIAVAAPSGGLADVLAGPGQSVKRDEVLAHVTPALSRTMIPILAPRDGVVIEAPEVGAGRLGVRRGATLFRLAGGSKAARTRLVRLSRGPAIAEPLATGTDRAAPNRSHTGREDRSAPRLTGAPGGETVTRIGWVERVSLPLLGIDRLKAKIDTGARTSALHVSRLRPVGTAAGPHRRQILEITIPHAGATGHRTLVIRAPVREYVQVKDTSGRSERRPVIETTIRLGAHERRIRVTLTDRGDMLFPMLIGRTALGPGMVVDPARRYLLPAAPLLPGRRRRLSASTPPSPGPGSSNKARRVDGEHGEHGEHGEIGLTGDDSAAPSPATSAGASSAGRPVARES